MNFHWRDGNRLQLLENGEEFFPAVFEAIAAAEKEVLLETFIFFKDKVGQELQQTLIAAAERGVSVDVTVDGYGSADLDGDFAGSQYFGELDSAVDSSDRERMEVRVATFAFPHSKV